MIAKIKDPVSGLTHLLGAVLSVVALVLLVYNGAKGATPWHVVSFSIFGASLILLYTASTIYHMIPAREKGTIILRKIDHMMIYILIAGTYTPICLVPLRGGWGWSLFGVVWAIAIGGIIMKAFWLNAPRWLYTLIYLGMGWIVAIAFLPLLRTLPSGGMLWLVIGGGLYTLGAVIYGTKWPKFNFKHVGFHEIFHIFILGGSFSHFWLMYKYILYIN